MYSPMTPAAVRMRLREILRQKGMTQKELAEQTGLNPNTISSIARGNYSRIGMDTIGKICDALGVEPGDLIVKTNGPQ